MPSVGTLLAYLEMSKAWSQLGYSESQNLPNLPNLPTDDSKKLLTVGGVGVKNCEKFVDLLNGWSPSVFQDRELKFSVSVWKNLGETS